MRVLLAIGLTLFSAAPIIACERDSGAVPLPGESKEEFERRDYEVLSEQSAVYAMVRERAAFKESSVAYIAVVKSSMNSLNSPSGIYEAMVEPKKALKGRLPHGDRKLANPNTGGLCFDAGDGSGANGRPGEIVVVFEGLSKTRDRLNGIDSLRAKEIRSSDLLDALAAYLGHEVSPWKPSN